MTLDRDTLARRRARRRRRGTPWGWIGGVALLAVVFAVGVALGEALHDNPEPGGQTTTQRTLRPVGATTSQLAERTDAVLAGLETLPNLRIFRGVRPAGPRTGSHTESLGDAEH